MHCGIGCSQSASFRSLSSSEGDVNSRMKKLLCYHEGEQRHQAGFGTAFSTRNPLTLCWSPMWRNQLLFARWREVKDILPNPSQQKHDEMGSWMNEAYWIDLNNFKQVDLWIPSVLETKKSLKHLRRVRRASRAPSATCLQTSFKPSPCEDWFWWPRTTAFGLFTAHFWNVPWRMHQTSTIIWCEQGKCTFGDCMSLYECYVPVNLCYLILCALSCLRILPTDITNFWFMISGSWSQSSTWTSRIPPGSSGTVYPCLENRCSGIAFVTAIPQISGLQWFSVILFDCSVKTAWMPKDPKAHRPSQAAWDAVRNFASLASWPTKRCLLLLRCLGLRTTSDFGRRVVNLLQACSHMFTRFWFILNSSSY